MYLLHLIRFPLGGGPENGWPCLYTSRSAIHEPRYESRHGLLPSATLNSLWGPTLPSCEPLSSHGSRCEWGLNRLWRDQWCPRPPILFNDGYWPRTWRASFILLSDHLSSWSKMWTWHTSKSANVHILDWCANHSQNHLQGNNFFSELKRLHELNRSSAALKLITCKCLTENKHILSSFCLVLTSYFEFNWVFLWNV